jgi:hypothetical protein
MNKIFLLMIAAVQFLAWIQVNDPDFSKKQDLEHLGTGTIIEKDNSMIKRIKLIEVKDLSIVYLKDESLHDMEIERIKRIEFPDSHWGWIDVGFRDNKPYVIYL